MILSIFAVILIAFFVVTVWFEAPVEPVRRAKDHRAGDEDHGEAAEDLSEAA